MTRRGLDRLTDGLLFVLLLLAAVQAVRLTTRPGSIARAYVPVLTETTPSGSVQGPGTAERALTTELATLGDWLSVEDLARGVLALERGELEGVDPLSPSERARVTTLVRDADEHRRALLAVEAQMAASEAALGDAARNIARTLTSEQRAWIAKQRDDVSVGQLEAAYWAEVTAALAADPAPRPTAPAPAPE